MKLNAHFNVYVREGVGTSEHNRTRFTLRFNLCIGGVGVKKTIEAYLRA